MQGKRGRPTVAPHEASAQVSARVPVSIFDGLCDVASRRREPMADTVRRALRREIETENGQDSTVT